MRVSLSLLSSSLVLLFIGCIFFGCNKNKYDNPFGKMKTGKYVVTMHKEYPSGATETLSYDTYGPENTFDQGSSFNIISSENYMNFSVLHKYKSVGLYQGQISSGRKYTITSIDVSKTEVNISFEPYIIPPPPTVDSAYGTIVFKYIEL